jgi:hypothetical protein
MRSPLRVKLQSDEDENNSHESNCSIKPTSRVQHQGLP